MFKKLSIALDGLETSVLFNKNMGFSDLAGILLVTRYKSDPLTDWMLAFIRIGLTFGEVSYVIFIIVNVSRI